MPKNAALPSILLLAVVSTTPTASFAQLPGLANIFQGTPEEQAACRPDVSRMCKAATPDVFRVLACLQSHRPRLSRPCRAVLENHGQ
jgi:hypothetical protein